MQAAHRLSRSHSAYHAYVPRDVRCDELGMYISLHASIRLPIPFGHIDAHVRINASLSFTYSRSFMDAFMFPSCETAANGRSLG